MQFIINDLSGLQNLISSETPESTSLEYKAAAAISNAKEITKDVSSLANGAGGIIIYGLTEKDNKPDELDSIKEKKFSREYLDQVIALGIQPPIKFKTEPIPYDGGYVYAVHVDRGETAHMSLEQKRYYRRYNFIAVAMEDHEIRDLMNRNKHPAVSLLFKVKGTRRLVPYLFNSGKIIAKHIRCFIYVPDEYLFEKRGEKINIDKVDYWQIDEKNEGKVLHAGLKLKLGDIKLTDRISDEFPIIWEVHADNAEKNKRLVLISDIYKESID